MAKTFEPSDNRSWYFGRISRQDATDLLMNEKDGGVFLVRDSATIPGDYVLCVKEDCKVCHYIINKVGDADGTRYKIGDRFFPDLESLLSFYKLHYLDTTPLVRPATRRLEQVIANYDFEGNDPEDLPFKRGEVLTIIRKDEDQWWSAKNGLGRVGAIPVPYVKPYDDSQGENNLSEQSSKTIIVDQADANPQPKQKVEWHEIQYARVKQARVPNAYDDTALKLQVGDIIRVTKKNMSGQWEGEVVLEDGRVGKKGHFPFNFVDFPIEFEPNTNKADENHATNSTSHNNITNSSSPRPPNDSIQAPD